MSKFNSKTISASVPTEINHMGEKAFVLSPEMDLVLATLTTFVEDSYYEKSSDLLNRIKNLVNKCDPYFVAQLAIYARTKANMRSISHVLAVLIAPKLSGTTFGKSFYEMLIVRPDDMAETLAFYKMQNGNVALPNAMKKGFKSALENLDNYQISKYKMTGKTIKMVDLANLLHPKTNSSVLHSLMKGESVIADTWETKLSTAGQIATDEMELADMKSNAWETILNSKEGIPIFALIRNLRNILEQAPHMIDEVCNQLTNKNKILNSRLLPFRFIQAYSIIESLEDSDKIVKFSNENEKNKVLNALETAMNFSIENLPDITGKVAILSDNSGSMGGDYGGWSFTSANSKVTTANIANLFATMMYMKSNTNYVGLFGDKLLTADTLNIKDGLAKNYKKLSSIAGSCWWSTEQGIYDFFDDIIKNKTKVDMVVVFSDCQIGNKNLWYGEKSETRQGDFQERFKNFRKINPNATVISINLKNYGTTVFEEGVFKIGGWSDKVIDLIEKVGKDKNAMVNEIKKIDIANWKRGTKI